MFGSAYFRTFRLNYFWNSKRTVDGVKSAEGMEIGEPPSPCVILVLLGIAVHGINIHFELDQGSISMGGVF